MLDAPAKEPSSPFHFLIIRGDMQDIQEIGLANRVIVERLSITDKRLWAYRKVTIPPTEKLLEIKLMLEEYLIPILCVDCSNYLELCLEDIQDLEGDEQ